MDYEMRIGQGYPTLELYMILASEPIVMTFVSILFLLKML